MKKVINVMAVAVVLSLAIISCDKKKDNDNVQAEPVPETTEDTVLVQEVEQHGDTINSRTDTVVVEKTTVTE